MKTQLKYFLIEIFINFTKIRSEFLNILFKFKQNLNNYNNYKIEINKLINRIVDESCIKDTIIFDDAFNFLINLIND